MLKTDAPPTPAAPSAATVDDQHCDRCGPTTRAAVLVDFTCAVAPKAKPSRLTFCGHHWDAAREAFTAQVSSGWLRMVFLFDNRR